MPKQKILVADDSPTALGLIQAALEEEYQVITASDGQEALEKVLREHPALVLLDIEMPKVNGFVVCQKLKQDPKTKAIPIVMLTVRDKESDKQWGLGMGADEYLTKPFEPDELLAIVKERLK